LLPDGIFRAYGHFEHTRSYEPVFNEGPALLILDDSRALELREVLRRDRFLDTHLGSQLAHTPGPLLKLLEHKESHRVGKSLEHFCPKCKALEQHAKEAIAELGLEAEIEKVTEIEQIMSMGVMMTPALAIDGIVKSAGRVLTKDQITAYLKEGK
jgi:small redox-active disulfide protein 2